MLRVGECTRRVECLLTASVGKSAHLPWGLRSGRGEREREALLVDVYGVGLMLVGSSNPVSCKRCLRFSER